MALESNKALVGRYIEMWETGNVALADEILAAEYVDHTHPDRLPGPEPVKQEVLAFRAGFSDVSITVEQMIGEADLVAFRFTLRATHRATFAGFAPTGKAVVLTGGDFIRIAGGKMVELWSCQETLSWVLQLGATVSFPQ
jgi:steroid delta-isomerase-like uncharacterized protein